MSKHGDKGEGSREHANFSDLISKSGQFGLQRGFLWFLDQGLLENTVLTVLSNSQNKHFSSSFQHLWAWNHEGVAFFTSCIGRNIFLDANWFSGHGRFVCNDIVTFNKKTVNRYNLSCFYNLNISNKEFVDIDVFDCIFPNDVDIFFGCDFVQFFELLFLDPVVTGCNCNYDHHCHQDGCALHPSVFPALGCHSQYEWNHRSYAENSEHFVLETCYNLNRVNFTISQRVLSGLETGALSPNWSFLAFWRSTESSSPFYLKWRIPWDPIWGTSGGTWSHPTCGCSRVRCFL